MALDKIGLKNNLIALLTTMKATEDPISAINDFADGLTNHIDTFVKSGTVNTTVATTGTAAAQTGTGVGSIT